MQFTERSPIETGFAAVFDAEIRPKLQVLDAERAAARRRALRNIGYVFLAAVLLFAAIFLIWGEDTGLDFALPVGALAVVGAWIAWSLAGQSWRSSVADAIMPSICTHVGDLTYEPRGDAFAMQPLRSLTLVPVHDKATLTSRLAGTYQNTAYEMVHAALSKRSRDSKGRNRSKTVFRGLLFHIAVPAPSPGRIVLMRDRGGLGNALAETFAFGGSRTLPRVRFDHAAFEAAFEVYAEQPEAAQTFMPDAFLDALLKIGDEQGQGRGARAFVAGFEGASFYLALKRSGRFLRVGRLTKPVADMEEDLHAVFDDITLSHRIIDRLHGV